MSGYKSKIWLGVGVCTFLGAADQLDQQVWATETLKPAIQVTATDGGEGGESGAGVEVGDQDAFDYIYGLSLMEGTMRAGRDLYESGDHGGALVQFNALLDIFKGETGQKLESLGFERDHVLVEAEQLPQAIADEESYEEFLHVYDHVLRELDGHALNVEAIERRNPAFIARVAAALLQDVAMGYASKDANAQSRAGGLARVLRDRIGARASKLRELDRDAFTRAIGALDQMVDLVPVLGSSKAEASKIFGLAATVEFALSTYK